MGSLAVASFFFFFFSCSMWDLVHWPSVEPGPPALEAQSLSHWTTREVPSFISYESSYTFKNYYTLSIPWLSTQLSISWFLYWKDFEVSLVHHLIGPGNQSNLFLWGDWVHSGEVSWLKSTSKSMAEFEKELIISWNFPGGSVVKNLPSNKHRFDPWSGLPWRLRQ